MSTSPTTKAKRNGHHTPSSISFDMGEQSDFDREWEERLAKEAQRRREWADTHAAKIEAICQMPAKRLKNGALAKTERIWRTRYWIDGELVIATLGQILGPTPGVSPSLKIHAYVIRGFDAHPSVVPDLVQHNQEVYEELVAFFRLDTIDPSLVDWRDATVYSSIAVVSAGAVAGGLRRQD